MLALYIDEDSMFVPFLHALRGRGFDVLSAAEAGRQSQSDEDHLEFATADGRIIVTSNVADYILLHQRYLSEGHTHAGIVLLTQRRLLSRPYAGALVRLAEEVGQEGMRNRLEYLSSWL